MPLTGQISQPLISTRLKLCMRWQCAQEVAAGCCAEALRNDTLLQAPWAHLWGCISGTPFQRHHTRGAANDDASEAIRQPEASVNPT